MEYGKLNADKTVVIQKILLTNGLAGGISLTLDVIESPKTLMFSGIGHVFQATNPVLDVHSNVAGTILPLLTLGDPTPLYQGKGSDTSGCLLFENLEFDFQLNSSKDTEGTGRFRFRESINSKWVDVSNCKVVIEQTTATEIKVA